MITCKKCNVSKEEYLFRERKQGFFSKTCRECENKKDRERRALNKAIGKKYKRTKKEKTENQIAKEKQYEEKRRKVISANDDLRERKNEYNRKYYEKNKVKALEHKKEYKKKNRWKRNTERMRYFADKAKRTPSWASKEKIAEYYKKAELLTKETGAVHHVDHIIPLHGKNVCGLHVQNNLQVITANENFRKSNKFKLCLFDHTQGVSNEQRID